MQVSSWLLKVVLPRSAIKAVGLVRTGMGQLVDKTDSSGLLRCALRFVGGFLQGVFCG